MSQQPGPSVANSSTSALVKVVRRLLVRGPGSESAEYELRQPHAVIGAAADCDIRLEHPEVSQRHAYLQVIWGQIACVDLCSRTGIQWSGESKEMDWLTLGRRARIGPYTIELIDDGRGNDAELGGFPIECNALLPEQDFFGPLPTIDLEWLNAKTKKPRKRIKRLITLVGRERRCQLRLNDASVSRVHCSLVLTQRRFWIVDLLGRGGTLINGQPVECSAPDNGDVLQVGGFGMKFRIGASGRADTNPTRGARRTRAPASRQRTSGTAQVRAPLSRTASSDADLKHRQPSAVSGFGSVFRVNLWGPTLVVSPIGERLAHDHTDLQQEMQLLERQVDAAQTMNVIFDLGSAEYAGSEIIGVIVHISKRACDSGGQAAVCNADFKMHRVLDTMRLFDLWPYYESTMEALKAFGDHRFNESPAGHALEDEGHVLLSSEADSQLASEASSVISLEWFGTLFSLERERNTLIIAPLVKGGQFEYATLHTESNAMVRKLDHPEINALVLDLGQVDYLGSELIGVIIKLGRKMSDEHQLTVLCNVSDSMRRVLGKMKIDKLWPIVDSRNAALRRTIE